MARNLTGNGLTDECLNCGEEMDDTSGAMFCEGCGE